MTVLYVDNSYTFGGAINALADLLKAIDRSRIRPIVLSAQPESVLQRFFPGTEIHHWTIRLPWVKPGLHTRIQKLPGFRSGILNMAVKKLRALYWLFAEDLPETRRIMRFMRQNGVGLVHLNNGVNGMVPALWAAKLLRLPVIAHGRGPTAEVGFRRHYAKVPDRWIAVSGSVKENLLRVGVAADRIDVVHDAIDLSTFSEAPPPPSLRQELGVPEDALVFAIFARVVPWKGIHEFVRAAAEVVRAVPGSIALVVGDHSDGPPEYVDMVVDIARAQGVADRVIFTGFRTDVADVMRACDVVVHTSVAPEPFGLVIIEGMACGKPVVAANAGGPTEIIQEGDTGLLVDPTDTAALSGAITRLLKDREYADAMGRRGASHVRRFYSAGRYARDVEAAYGRLEADVFAARESQGGSARLALR